MTIKSPQQGYSVAQECGMAAQDGLFLDDATAIQSQSGLKLSDRSELQAREDRERKDRAGWFPMDNSMDELEIRNRAGHLIATCLDESDRQTILTMARSYDAMREALGPCITAISFECERAFNEKDGVALRQLMDARALAISALSLANGSKKEADEEIASYAK